MSMRLTVSPNITIIALPSKSPELNLLENVWKFMRDNWPPIASLNPTMQIGLGSPALRSAILPSSSK